MANKAVFHNCLTYMRPQTIKNDLPSAYNVNKCLLNEFVEHLNELKTTITASHHLLVML